MRWRRSAEESVLIINPLVYAEVSVDLPTIEELRLADHPAGGAPLGPAHSFPGPAADQPAGGAPHGAVNPFLGPAGGPTGG